jgi:hypothetical protein
VDERAQVIGGKCRTERYRAVLFVPRTHRIDPVFAGGEPAFHADDTRFGPSWKA